MLVDDPVILAALAHLPNLHTCIMGCRSRELPKYRSPASVQLWDVYEYDPLDNLQQVRPI
jgi:hypothetical protein